MQVLYCNADKNSISMIFSSRNGTHDTSDHVYTCVSLVYIGQACILFLSFFTLLVNVLSSRNLFAKIRAVVNSLTSDPIDPLIDGYAKRKR